MIVVERDTLIDDWVCNFGDVVQPGSLVVLNDTRVRHARVLGKRRGSGGKVELLLLGRVKACSQHNAVERWQALGKPSRGLRAGTWVDAEGFSIQVIECRGGGHFTIDVQSTDGSQVECALERWGHVPIPPYLGRPDEPGDKTRYQTIYAKRHGSVAAPTAGLHLTERTLEVLRERQVEIGHVTLHVGIGTFRPVAVADLDDHPMHSEWFAVSAGLAERVATARRRGKPVVAVGTTAVRALESAADAANHGCVKPTSGLTCLLIQPGYRFGVVDGFLTNFHQPKSTLLALVSAAIGVERTHEAYRVAIERGYRFLSYGDAMWIPQRLL